MPYGPVPFDSPNLTLEAIICEIIDNSIAAGAKHIHVEIGDDISLDGRESLNFSVYDDGKKILRLPGQRNTLPKRLRLNTIQQIPLRGHLVKLVSSMLE